jgi:excisionase family DNA binding protein
VSGPLLTAREVGEVLGVHAETVLRWTRRGELPAIRLPGGALRYRDHVLEAWLDSRGATPGEEVSPTPADAAAARPLADSEGRRLGLVTHPEDEEAS